MPNRKRPQMKFKSSAPGKLIISGEHAVVYGYPALSAAVSLRASAEAIPREDKKQTFKSNIADVAVLKLAAEKTFSAFRQPEQGFSLRVRSDIPVGSGLGSSASVSAACVSSLLKFLGKKKNKEALNKIVYETEKEVHANPSGIDNTTVVYGGFIKFKKINDKFKIRQLRKNRFLPEFILVQSGQPKETTKEMVLMVRANIDKNKQILAKIGKVAKEFISDFEEEKFNPELLRENQRLLERLGVVGKRAQKIIHLVEGVGGVAKVCGAGGVKAGSGILLIYCKDLNEIKLLLKKEGLDFFSVSLGKEGVR